MTILRTNTIAGIGTTFGPLLDGNLEFNSQNYVILPKGSSSQEGVLRNTADVVGTGGTYYDNLVLAMPFNEATGLRDVSSRNRNPAAYGNVAISTAQSKYYGSSAYFDGSGDYLSIDVGISTSTSDFVLGPSGSNFTIEFYLYATSSASGGIISTYSDWNNIAGFNNRWAIIIASDNTIRWYSSTGATGISDTSLLNQWVHYAICRSGSTVTMYRNGTSVGTQTTLQDYTLANPLVIGYLNGLGHYTGYLQDLRIYKGLAKYTANFTPPERIAEVGVGFKTGQLRYNTDSNKVELYDGNQWVEVQSSRPDLNGGARGVFGGGFVTPSNTNTIEYITISSTGNAQDFGDLFQTRRLASSCSSSTRGLFGGGYAPGSVNTIDFITISSTGNAADFGDLTQGRYGPGACSNSTRGIFSGGNSPSVPAPGGSNVIDYVTIASAGNAVDFGDTTVARWYTSSSSSQTRGIIAGGATPAASNVIDYTTISTLGNATDFGDLIQGRYGLSSCANATHALFAGGQNPSSYFNTIDYITIATLGNAVNFGSLTITRGYGSSCSSPTRGVFSGGYTPSPSANYNTIDYVTILAQGNAVDFGDLIALINGNAACSNAHGGL
jgi:hypothetical protein